MKPLIKYTGGKYREFDSFKEYIPKEINNYYEPFVGGGGVFFKLHEKKLILNKSYLNDISKDLMDFYECVKNPLFLDELILLNNVWEEIKRFSHDVIKVFGETFFDIVLEGKKDAKSDLFQTKIFINYIKYFIENNTYIKQYDFFGFSLIKRISLSLTDKLSRFSKKGIKEEDTHLIEKCIKTAICQAFYFTLRDIYNKWLNDSQFEIDKVKKSTIWCFIREFCWGAMFRFSNGYFNIPYGGDSYNKKCLRCKIENISSEETQNIFKNVELSSVDYSEILDREFEEGDFIFFDPPYDSTFSEYDNNSFDADEQKRLSDFVKTLDCKWMMVVRKTPLICELYKDYEMIEFDKTYTYNAKGEYKDKNSIHLIIKNYVD